MAEVLEIVMWKIDRREKSERVCVLEREKKRVREREDWKEGRTQEQFSANVCNRNGNRIRPPKLNILNGSKVING